MKKIKIKQKGRVINEVILPTCWEEVNTEFFTEFNRVSLLNDAMALLEVSTKLSKEALLQCEDINLDDLVYETLSFWGEYAPLLAYSLPPHIIINDKKIKVPTDLEAHTLGQKLELKSLVNQENAFLNNFIEIFCVYFTPLVGVSREEMREITKTLRIIDVYPIVGFFLRKYNAL